MKYRRLAVGLIIGLLAVAGCAGGTDRPGVTEEGTRTETPALTPTNMPEPSLTPTNTPVPTPSNTPVPTNTPTPTSTPTPTPTSTPTPTPPASATLAMVGDILLHSRIETYSKQSDGTYNFDSIFANLKDELSAADVAIVNQEVIIGGEELGVSGYPKFNAPYAIGDALVKSGFDVVLHATNHALDKGKDGLLNCITFWKENYPEIGVVGIHETEESAAGIYIKEINGIKIAILNYTYSTNGKAMPSGMPYAVDMLKEAAVVADIKLAKELADFVVVCPHWGTEYSLTPSKSQKNWTQVFLENGVDLVLGTHPHVIEPIEWKVNEETGEKMLVYYSIGNFVNWTSSTKADVPNRMLGGLAEIKLERKENGEVEIVDYGVEAVVCHVEEKTNGVTVYSLSEYTTELAEQNAINSQTSKFSKEYLIDLCNQVWGNLWH